MNGDQGDHSACSDCNRVFAWLSRGAVFVGEVRGWKSEIGKKFDKSNKDAPPMTFGVFKINLETPSDGTPVSLSIYPGQGADLDGLAERLKLKKGALVAVNVGRMEQKDGQRRAVCDLDSVHVLEPREAALLSGGMRG